MYNISSLNGQEKSHAENRKKILLELQETYRMNSYRLSPDFSHNHTRNVIAKGGEPDSPVVEDLLIEMNQKRIKYDDNYTACYRCKHFLNVPPNLFEIQDRISDCTKEYEADLSFVQSIVWLKSAIALMKNISIEQFHQLFHKQWRDCTDKRDNVEPFNKAPCDSLNSPVTSNCNAEDTSSDSESKYTSSIDLLCVVKNNRSNNALDCSSNKVSIESKSSSPLSNTQSPERYFKAFTNNNGTSENYVIPETDGEYSSSSDIFRDTSESSEVYNNIYNKNYNETLNESQLTFNRSIGEISSISQKICVTQKTNFNDITNEDSLSTDITIFQSDRHRPISGSGECTSIENAQESVFINHEKDTADYSNQISIRKSSQKDSMYEIYQLNTELSSSSIRKLQNEDVDYLTNRGDVISTPHQQDSAYETNDFEHLNMCVIDKDRISDKGCNLQTFSLERFSSKKRVDTKGIIESTHCKSSSTQKRQLEYPNSPKEEEKIISSQWLRFTLDALSVDDVAFQSVKVILSVFQNEMISRQYMRRRCWKDTLENQAMEAVLNFCEVYEAENKSNAYTQEVVRVVINVLDKSIENTELNKIALLTHRVSIILELCCSMKVCIETINYLIKKLKSLENDLISIMKGKKADVHRIVHQLHVLLYALKNCLLKYRLVFHNKEDDEFEEITIVPVIDLWKKRLTVEGVMVDDSPRTREQHWLMVLDGFTIIAVEDFPRFAEKSRRLVNLLNCKEII